VTNKASASRKLTIRAGLLGGRLPFSEAVLRDRLSQLIDEPTHQLHGTLSGASVHGDRGEIGEDDRRVVKIPLRDADDVGQAFEHEILLG